MDKRKRILIIAGEASGDMHAAKLLREVHALDSDIEFLAMGGPKMRAAGAKMIIDSADLAVMGALDVLLQLKKIRAALAKITDILAHEALSCVVLVNYPGFNLRVAKIAKKYGVKVIFYIGPQLWASRPSRIKAIRKYVDIMAVIFPFEVAYYQTLNMPVTFVGNPLLDEVKPTMTRQEALQKFNLKADSPVVGLFPGSRKGEIKRLLPVIMESARLLKKRFPNVQFIMPLASSLEESDIAVSSEITLVKGYNYDVIEVCDAIIAVSGTVTLEIALMAVPLVIIYKIFPPFIPIKWFINIPYIGLCNIIAGHEVAKELLQQHASAKNICQEISRILEDENYRTAMQASLRGVRDKLLMKDEADLAKILIDNEKFLC